MRGRNNFELKKLATAFTLVIFLFGIVPLAVLPVPVSANHGVTISLSGGYPDPSGATPPSHLYFAKGVAVGITAQDGKADGFTLLDPAFIVEYPSEGSWPAEYCKYIESSTGAQSCGKDNYNIAANDKMSWNWDQKYNNAGAQKNGQQVPNGWYDIVINTCPLNQPNCSGTKNAITYWSFDFAIEDDSDSDGISDTPDMCPDEVPTVDTNHDGCQDSGNPGAPPPDDEGTSGEPPKPSPDEQDASQSSGVGEGLIALGATIGSLVFLPLAIPVAIAEVVGWLWYTGNLGMPAATAPDSNYASIVPLQHSPFTPLAAADVPAGLERVLPLTNALLKNGVDFKDAAQSYVSANQKYLGAKQANDFNWMNVHAAEVRQFAAKIVYATDENSQLLDSVKSFTANSGYDRIITKADVANFQNSLRTNGQAALPQIEVQAMKNNLKLTDVDVQNVLIAPSLNTNVNDWTEETLGSKIDKLKPINIQYRAAFEWIAINFGSNVILAETPADGTSIPNRFLKFIPVKVADTPNIAHAIIINIGYDIKKSKFISATPAMLLPDGQYFVNEVEPGKIVAMVYSKRGMPAGTSNTLLNLRFAVRGTSTISALFDKWQVGAKVASLAGDSTGWQYPTKAYLSTTPPTPVPPPAPFLPPKIPIFKNGAWVAVTAPTTQPPSGSASGTSWWDGSAWITSPQSQYGVVWTGAGGSATGPSTVPPKGTMYSDSATPAGKTNVWDGYQYVLTDAAAVAAALPPNPYSIFDVGIMAWTFTSLMPPPNQ